MRIFWAVFRKITKGVNKLAYIHIPKTGGSYLGQLESDLRPVVSSVYYLGHVYVVDKAGVPNAIYYPRDLKHSNKNVILLPKIERYLVVSTVRNIFDWLVSYAGHAGGWTPRYRNPEHYDFEAANKSFDFLLKTIANREDLWPNRKFIHCQLFCNNGQLIIDWLNRAETLDNDLAALASLARVKHNPRPKQRVGKRRDYRKYYTDSLVELVYETWGRELKLFGYEFEHPESSSGLLSREINPQTKESILYSWSDDQLSVNGELIRSF
jgi:hypothetical protein